jgi:hypothetical protein
VPKSSAKRLLPSAQARERFVIPIVHPITFAGSISRRSKHHAMGKTKAHEAQFMPRAISGLSNFHTNAQSFFGCISAGG